MPKQASYAVDGAEKALIVCVETDEAAEPYAVEELRSLAVTAGAEVVGEFHQHRQQPDPAYYIGKGKAEEIAAGVLDARADFVIVDCELTPTQQRNLQEALQVRVIDRTQ